MTGSQLGECDGWTDGSTSPTEDGWRIYVQYWGAAGSDKITLFDAHVYFDTDLGNGDGLFCPMSDHEFVPFPGNWAAEFSCQWS